MTVVLDASALMAFLNCETGADVVQETMSDAVISTVNFSEVVAKLAERGDRGQDIEAVLHRLDLEVHHFDAIQSFAAGMLRPMTRSAGLSLGDRACIALGIQLGCGVLTSDREWAALDTGAEIRSFR